MNKKTRRQLKKIYHILYTSFGPQHWWPGETSFEVLVGAILTQNTNWRNVEKAIQNLKQAKCLTPKSLYEISLKRLTRLIQPSGFFNIKAKRLKNFIVFTFKEYSGQIARMRQKPLEILRPEILSVNGIGPETADSILLYALGKPIFVIDAYTKRIFSRHKFCRRDIDYHSLQEIFMGNLSRSTQLYNEFHAMIVKLGKDYCRRKPRCQICPLRTLPHILEEHERMRLYT